MQVQDEQWLLLSMLPAQDQSSLQQLQLRPPEHRSRVELFFSVAGKGLQLDVLMEKGDLNQFKACLLN